MNYRRIKKIMISLILVVSITQQGCSSKTKTVNQEDSYVNKESNTNIDSNLDENKNSNEDKDIEEKTKNIVNTDNTETNRFDLEEMFTDRDKEIGYEESTAIPIILKDNLSQCDSSLVSISENKVIIKGEGTFLLSGKLTNGQIIIDAKKTEKLHLIFDGVEIHCDTSAPLYIRQADKVFITLEQETENILSNEEEFIAIDDNNIDAAIFSKEDITFNGNGSLKVTSTGHGIVSKDDLVFTGGSYEIEAKEHAVNGKESVRIANGSFEITAGEDGIHAKDKDDASLGFVYIAGGDFKITAGDDGIHADNSVIITDGTITVLESYEGIEGLNIEILNGTITVKASDDGCNAAGGNDGSGFGGHGEDPFAVNEDSYIKISGGTITVNAEGDGIDSNGNLFISGGTVYISGPINRGNGALDYNGTGTITGGIVVAAGAGGMEQNFGEDSTQGSILVNAGTTQTEAIILKNEKEEELLSYLPEKSYSSVVISCPEIKKGESYKVTLGEENVTVEMTDLIYGTGNMMGHGGHNGMKGIPGNGEIRKPDGNKMPPREGMENRKDFENQPI